MRMLCSLLVVLLTQTFSLAALTPEASTEQVLDALYEVGKDLKSFSANVNLRETDLISQDSSSRTGLAVYEKQPSGDSRMRVTFLKRVQDNLTQDQRMEYLLEAGWLVDRNYPRKLEVKRQVLKPGEKINLLKLGEGPFPLPIGQKREDVLKLFDVTKIAPANTDPANTVHIRLSPKPNTKFARQFTSIDAWVDLASTMPTRIETVDANETLMRGTDLSDIRLNVNLTQAHFQLPDIPGDWQKKEEAYSE